jgi:hypothetical protein
MPEIFLERTLLDVLGEMKEIKYALDQVPTDIQPAIPGKWLNKAKNRIANLIADGDRRLQEKLQQGLEQGEHDWYDK